MRVLLLVILCALWSAQAQEVAKGAGIAVHIKQELFDNLKESVLKEFIESIETGNFEDVNIVKDLSMFKVKLDLTNMTLHDFKMDVDTSFLELRDTAPYLELFLSNFSLTFTFDFDFRTDPVFLKDQGKGYINIEPTSLYLGYGVESHNGRPVFTTESALMNCTDLTIVMNGTADFSKVLFQLSAYLKDIFKTKINDFLTGIVDATVTPAVNGMIASYYNTTYEWEENLIANFSSTKEPVFTNDDMTIFFKGEIHPKDEPNLPFSDALEVVSEVKADGRQLQIAISDYLLNSTIYSMYKTEYLKVDTADFQGESYDLPASYLFYVFPKLSEMVSPDTPVYFKVVAKEDKYLPYMQIVNGTTTAYIDFEIDMKTEDQTLLRMDTSAQIEVNVYIVKGFKLTVDVQMLKIKLKEIIENNIDPEIDDRDISSFIGFVSGFARNYVNQFVRNFEVKLPIGDNISLDDVELEELSHYVYADVTPHISLNSDETDEYILSDF